MLIILFSQLLQCTQMALNLEHRSNKNSKMQWISPISKINRHSLLMLLLIRMMQARPIFHNTQTMMCSPRLQFTLDKTIQDLISKINWEWRSRMCSNKTHRCPLLLLSRRRCRIIHRMLLIKQITNYSLKIISRCKQVILDFNRTQHSSKFFKLKKCSIKTKDLLQIQLSSRMQIRPLIIKCMQIILRFHLYQCTP